MIVRVAVQKHAVFAFAGDVFKTDIFNFSRFRVVITVECGQHNRLCRAPPIRAKTTRFNDNVGIRNIFHIAAVADLNGQPAVTSRNDAVGNEHIAKIAHALCTDFDCR